MVAFLGKLKMHTAVKQTAVSQFIELTTDLVCSCARLFFPVKPYKCLFYIWQVTSQRVKVEK